MIMQIGSLNRISQRSSGWKDSSERVYLLWSMVTPNTQIYSEANKTLGHPSTAKSSTVRIRRRVIT